MKSFKTLLLAIVIPLLTGCGTHYAIVGNLNANNTNVELSQKNFVVLDKVSGTSTATYFFGIGGIDNKALVERAKAEMLRSVDFEGSSKAIVNLVTETHFTFGYPVFFKKTVTVSGHIIEFIK